MTEQESCGKSMCRTMGGCLFATIWDILTCPFVSCFKCTKHCCKKCCCCKDTQNQQQT